MKGSVAVVEHRAHDDAARPRRPSSQMPRLARSTWRSARSERRHLFVHVPVLQPPATWTAVVYSGRLSAKRLTSRPFGAVQLDRRCQSVACASSVCDQTMNARSVVGVGISAEQQYVAPASYFDRSSCSPPISPRRPPIGRSSCGRKPSSPRYRTTSAVELYGPNGRLVSRFALDPARVRRPTNTGRQLRRVGALRGGVAIRIEPATRAAREPRASATTAGGSAASSCARCSTTARCPSSRRDSPYLESLRPDARRPPKRIGPRRRVRRLRMEPRADLRTGHERVAASRRGVRADGRVARPFWTDVDRGDERVPRVFLQRPRRHLCARLSRDHVVRSPDQSGRARLSALVLFLLLHRRRHAFSTRSTSHTPASGRALLREVRSSFYRKLLHRRSSRLRSCRSSCWRSRRARISPTSSAPASKNAAAKTATVAQRLIEDYATLQQRGAARSTARRSDSWCSCAGHRPGRQSVRRPRLQATSERDLFASRLLPRARPADVYRQHRPRSAADLVGVEEVGGVPISARRGACPHRRAARASSRCRRRCGSRRSSGRRDELDRRVLFGAVLFMLLGGRSATGWPSGSRIPSTG